MGFADQNAIAALLKRVTELERRVAELEAKRGPGRPKNDDQKVKAA